MINFISKDRVYRLALVIGFGLIFFLAFYKLGFATLRDWDEARHGVNAYEMLQNGNWLITTYGYTNDYWNLKPMLSEWFIILGYKLFGFTPFGLRFYSVAAFILMVGICVVFCHKNIGRLSALMTLFGFAAWKIFYSFHFVRNGDADSLFVCLYVITVLSLYKMWDDKRYLYLACLCVSLGFLAKSVHAAVFAIVIFISVFATGYIKRLTGKNILLCFFFGIGADSYMGSLQSIC